MLLRKLEEHFSGAKAEARARANMELLIQGSLSSQNYYDKKLQLLNLLQNESEEAKVLAMKKGFNAEIRDKILLANSLSEIQAAIIDLSHMQQTVNSNSNSNDLLL